MEGARKSKGLLVTLILCTSETDSPKTWNKHPRQLSDINSAINLTTRYTPWGDALDTYGTGNFTFGYFGGVMDAATGLLCVGNGQYYDPTTGRFLTRDAKPNNSNPYMPWDPTGAIIGPLGVMSLSK